MNVLPIYMVDVIGDDDAVEDALLWAEDDGQAIWSQPKDGPRHRLRFSQRQDADHFLQLVAEDAPQTLVVMWFGFLVWAEDVDTAELATLRGWLSEQVWEGETLLRDERPDDADAENNGRLYQWAGWFTGMWTDYVPIYFRDERDTLKFKIAQSARLRTFEPV